MKNNVWINKRFLAYAFGLMIDRFGNAIYTVALPLLVYHISKSVLNMSLMAVVQFLPKIILGPYIGAIIDRTSRRKVIFLGLLFQGLCSTSMAVLFKLGLLQINMIYICGALLTLGFEFSRTAEMAVVPVMFGKQRVAATSALASIHTAMFIAGPTVAGICLTLVSYEILLWANSLTYLAPIIMCFWSRIPHERDLKTKSHESIFKTMTDGIRYVRKEKNVWFLLTVTLIVGIATSGIQNIILFYIKDTLFLSDGFASMLFACSGLGMFLGSFSSQILKNIERSRLLFASLILAFAGLSLLFIENRLSVFVAQFILSMGLFSFYVTKDILIQDHCPNQLLGRVNSLIRIILSLSFVISNALLGSIASKWGILPVFTFSILVLGGCLLFFLQRSIHVFNSEGIVNGEN